MKKKRFDTGGSTNVRTRSDDEIGDTNPRTGVYTPGSYAARQEQGQKNLDSVKGFFNKLTGKSADAAPAAPATYDENPAAKYIKKSAGQESAVSRPSESTISGSQVDKNKNYESEAAPIPAPAPAPAPAPEAKSSRKLPITIDGDYPKNAVKDEEVTESVKKADPKIDEAIKKKKAAAAAAKAKADAEAKAKADRKKLAQQKIEEHAKNSKEKIKFRGERINNGDRVGTAVPIKDVFSGADKSPDPYEKRNRAKNAMEDQIRDTMGSTMKRGGAVKKMASGGMTSRSSASSRGDGIASRGKTRGKIC